MPRYGPFMELLPPFKRFVANTGPVVLWLVISLAGFLGAIYVLEGRAGFMHVVFGK